MLRILIIGALIFLAWRLISRRGLLRAAHDPRPVPGATALTPHQVLGVGRDASPEEIRAAYQGKVRHYHPDKVAEMGPELRELAETRTKEINAAYELLRKRR